MFSISSPYVYPSSISKDTLAEGIEECYHIPMFYKNRYVLIGSMVYMRESGVRKRDDN